MKKGIAHACFSKHPANNGTQVTTVVQTVSFKIYRNVTFKGDSPKYMAF